jgi:hypothetical protein
MQEEQSEPLLDEVKYFVGNYHDNLPKDDSLKVIRLNHFFKWKGELMF